MLCFSWTPRSIEWRFSTKGYLVPGTSKWIKENDSYQAWLRGEEELLWISASPGKGNTMLSIFLIEELERRTRASNDTQVLYYFCNGEDEKRDNTVALLRGLLWQIIGQHPESPKRLVQNFGDLKKTEIFMSSLDAL